MCLRDSAIFLFDQQQHSFLFTISYFIFLRFEFFFFFLFYIYLIIIIFLFSTFFFFLILIDDRFSAAVQAGFSLHARDHRSQREFQNSDAIQAYRRKTTIFFVRKVVSLISCDWKKKKKVQSLVNCVKWRHYNSIIIDGC